MEGEGEQRADKVRVWSCCELRETRGILAPRRLTHEKEEEGEKEQEEAVRGQLGLGRGGGA